MKRYWMAFFLSICLLFEGGSVFSQPEKTKGENFLSINEVLVKFSDNYNNGQIEMLRSLFISENIGEHDFGGAVQALREIFGNIDVVGEADFGQFKKKYGKESGNKSDVLNASLLTDHYKNETNPVINSLYKIRFKELGDGYLQLIFPYDNDIVNEKLSGVVFIIPKEENFMGVSRAISSLKNMSDKLSTNAASINK